MSEDSLANLLLLSQFCQVYRNLLELFTEPISLPRAQASVLSKLVKQDGITQSELGEQLCVQGATVTNMLQRMEESGCIVRRRDTEDNRLVRVYLTDFGREKGNLTNEQFDRLEALLFEAISKEERELMESMLTRLLEKMRQITP